MTPPAANGGMRASVIGLGRIGAPLAACLAAGGLEVVGVDVDRRRVDALNAGRAPVAEPGLAELLASGPALRATTSVAEAVAASDVTFVTVPTPAEPDGSLSARHVLAAAEELGRALAGKRTGHVVAITSTVMPGSVGGPVTAAITAAAGREREPGIAVAFVPEFVALGSAIADFLAPDFVLIGEPYPGAAPELDELFRVVCRNEPPILRTGLIEAELAKLAINAFLATKVTFGNALAAVALRLGCDADAVSAILGRDRRIAPGYLTGGLPFGGPCLPRDTGALASLARAHDADPTLWDTVLDANARTLAGLVDEVTTTLPVGGTVGIYGLAFKPGVPVTEASPAAELASALALRGARTVAFDPALDRRSIEALGPSVEAAPSLEDCVARADVLVLAAPLEGARLDALRLNGAPTVIDCWRSLRRAGSAA